MSGKSSSSRHPNAAVHAKVMAALRAMSAEDRRQTLVDAGILTKTGKLTKPYRSAPALSYRETLAARSAK